MRTRNLLAAAAGVAIGIGIGEALAGVPGYYVTGEGGASLLPDLHFTDTLGGKQKDSFNAGFAAGGAVGYDFGDGIRIELNSLYQFSTVTRLRGAAAGGHLTSTSAIANATYDLLPDERFTPYIGAGLGLQNVGGSVNGLAGRDWEPAYQAEAGLRTSITDNASLFGEYRFSQSDSLTLANSTDSAHQHFSNHALLAGVSFKLN